MQQIKSFRWLVVLFFAVFWQAACSPSAESPAVDAPNGEAVPANSAPAPRSEEGVFKDDFESGETEAWSEAGQSEKVSDDGEAKGEEGKQDG